MCRVLFGLTDLPGLFGAIHFGILAHLGFPEDSEEDDPTTGREPVGQADRLTVVPEDESQFAEAVAEVAAYGSERVVGASSKRSAACSAWR